MKIFKITKSPDKSRVFRSGVYSTAILVGVIVLAILVNLIIRALPTKYTEFDLSEAGLYTLSDDTVEIAHNLTQDVTIYYLCETGNEDAIIKKLLNHYADESSHITWELKDPAIYPTFASQYGAETASSGSLIVVCGEKSVVLDAADLYEYDYSDYYTTGTYSVTFGGENQLTSAIYRLTSGEEGHVYYTTNHGEQALTDTLTETLENQNLAVAALDLLTSEIPEDCDVLIINNPASDFSAAGQLIDELGMLRTYLNGGGSLLVTTDSYYSTPNLDALLEEYGLSRTEGLVVEGNIDNAMSGYPLYLLPEYASTIESTVLDSVDENRRVLLQMAQGITITETENVEAEALLLTSEDAYSKLAGYEMTAVDREDGDTDGPLALAVWAYDEDTEAEIIWINCGNMDNEAVYQTVPGNVTFLQACASSLSGQTSTTLIASKALEAAPITVSGSLSAGLGLSFVILLPAAVLTTGAVVVLLRRRK